MNHKFKYIVVYKSEYLHDHIPLTVGLEDVSKKYKSEHHLFDKEMLEILPGLEYILHLPKSIFDLAQADAVAVEAHQESAHLIIPVPDTAVSQQLLAGATLIICQDECEEKISELMENNPSTLGINTITELNTILLMKHWKKLKEYVSKEWAQEFPILSTNLNRLELLSSDKLHYLSSLYYLLQHNNLEYFRGFIKGNENFNQYCYSILHHGTMNNTLLEVEGNDVEYNRKIYDDFFARERPKVVISLARKSHIQKNLLKGNKEIPEYEKRVIKILTAHRGISKNAIVINKEFTNYKAYDKVRALETHCKTSEKDSKYIWRALKEIGEEISMLFTENELAIIERASEISVFSDFPIGLGVINNNNSPLALRKPISYRPLTPLTRALTLEFTEHLQYFMHTKIRVVILECLSTTDKLKRVSLEFWKKMKEIISAMTDLFTFEIKEIDSMSMFYFELGNIGIGDILIISAHGIIKNNASALVIGNKEELLYPNKHLRVPQLIILSACNTSPRGDGVISVADSFLSCGARTVLGALVPINAEKNMKLLARLFINMSESENKRDYKSLNDIWSYVIATHAIEEILASSPKLKNWAYSGDMFSSPIMEFKMNPPLNLRISNIYEDSVRNMRIIAKKYGKEELFDSVINSQGYYPESLFYQLIGYPENIIIGNPKDKYNIN